MFNGTFIGSRPGHHHMVDPRPLGRGHVHSRAMPRHPHPGLNPGDPRHSARQPGSATSPYPVKNAQHPHGAHPGMIGVKHSYHGYSDPNGHARAHVHRGITSSKSRRMWFAMHGASDHVPTHAVWRHGAFNYRHLHEPWNLFNVHKAYH